AKGRSWKNCKCPIWAAGRLGSDYLKESLDTSNWEVAQTKARTMETSVLFPAEEKAEPISIEDAVEKFFDDCRARSLSPATISKYDVLLEKQLKSFAKNKGLRFLSELTVERVREFRQTWPDGPLSGYKKNERLRSFLKWCHDGRYIEENPAERVKPPK